MPANSEARRALYGVCGYEDTQGDEPCQQPAYYADDRCQYHSETDERKTDVERVEKTTIQVHDPTHRRILEHKREGETLTGVVARALDALDREAALPEAVTEVLRDAE